MKNLIPFLLIIILFSCNYSLSNKEELTINNNETNLKQIKKELSDYKINLSIDSISQFERTLIIEVFLDSGSHFVSPYSEGDYLGIFTLKLDDSSEISQSGSLKEIPASSIYENAFNGSPVNLVYGNTVYKQNLTLKTGNKFVLNGHIQFVIEPRCTMEKIPFKIISNNGSIEVVKTD